MPEISTRQKQYLSQMKKEKRKVFAARILLFLLFMGLWEVSAARGWIDSFIFSSPSLIIKTFLTMCRNQSLFSHITVTLAETLVSFFFVVILGVGTAILLWCSPRTSQVMEPYLVVLNSLPKSALAPLLIVWLGANERTIVVSGMSVAIFGSVINLYSGFCQADPDKLKLIETLGGHKKEKLTKIVLPASVPLIIGVGYLFYATIDIMRGGEKASVLWLIVFAFLLTMGEMFFSPLGHSFISKYSPSRYLAVMMSVWGFATFIAAKSYGPVYGLLFGGKIEFKVACIGVAVVSFAAALIMIALDKKLSALVD